MNDFFRLEYGALRTELHDLKSCQMGFLTYGTTATGALLGVITGLKLGASWGVAYLVPLAILLPFWWVFFDKATTITRIVGYMRALEEAISTDRPGSDWPGWERALKEFRARQEAGDLPDAPRPPKRRLRSALMLRTSHPYWVLVYETFLGLSLASWLVALARVCDAGPVWPKVLTVAAFLGIALSAWCNWHVLVALMWGRYSYDWMQEAWEAVLASPGEGAPSLAPPA